MRIWFSGRAQASQAWSAGSIPVIRLIMKGAVAHGLSATAPFIIKYISALR